MPSADLASHIAADLITAKSAGRSFQRAELTDFIRVSIEAYNQSQIAPIVTELLPAPTGITAEMIYQAYPRKVGKADALRAITKAIKHAETTVPIHWAVAPNWLFLRTQAYAAAVAQWSPAQRYTREGTDTVPHPATWYNRGSYLDDPREWQAKAARTASSTSNAARDYSII